MALITNIFSAMDVILKDDGYDALVGDYFLGHGRVQNSEESVAHPEQEDRGDSQV